MKKQLLTTLTFLCTIFSLAAQNTFTASTNKNKVGVNEQFSLSYTVNESGNNFSPPNLSNFIVLSGPNTSSSTTIINGKISQENSYTYYLRAKKVGIYTIASASIFVDGKKLRSNSITIQVLKSSPKPKNNNSPEAIARENVFLSLDLSNTSPYIGEQITATYKLYFKQEISSPELIENPSYTGFWHENFDLGENYPIKNEVLNGIKYQVATLKLLTLIPQREGELTIEQMELDVPVHIPTNQRDFFGRRRSRTINIICATGDKKINVKPLPIQGKPNNFNGAVGQFKFTTKLDRNLIKTNESATLSQRVNGVGNLRMIEMPEFQIPNNIESYEPKYKESISVRKNGLKGYKREESLLIPRNKGAYKIPSISFSYFDPSKKKYITESSPSYVLTVEGDSIELSKSVIVNNIEKEDVTFIGKDILYIKTNAGDLKPTSIPLFNKPIYSIIICLLFLLIIASIIVSVLLRKAIIDPSKWSNRKASKSAVIALKTNSNLDIYTDIEKALELFFKLKWKIDRSKFNKEYIQIFLNNKQVDEILTSELIEILEYCEMSRFMNSTSGTDSLDIKKRVEILIDNLENYN